VARPLDVSAAGYARDCAGLLRLHNRIADDPRFRGRDEVLDVLQDLQQRVSKRIASISKRRKKQ